MPVWKSTFKPPRLFIIDARVSVLFLIMLVDATKFTFGITILACLFLLYFEKRKRVSVEGAIRMMRSNLVTALSSTKRPAKRYEASSKAIDYGRMP